MSLKNIRGHDKPIQILKSYIKSGFLGGAYLFTGEEGIGKYLVARNFAKALNCLNNAADEDACDNCPTCMNIEKSQHPDVHFLESSQQGSIKIESVREIKKEINFKSYSEVKKKVFMINDAHNLTAEASNALLKILEEPPDDSLFILISAKPALLLRTIVSRCKVIRFHPLRRAELESFLKEEHSLENNLRHFLAYFCEGRIGSALKLKEMDILTQRDRVIDEFIFFGKKRNLVTGPLQDRKQINCCLNILASWFRDLYLVKAGLPHSGLVNFDKREELSKIADYYSLSRLNEIMEAISNSFLYLEQNVNTKLLLRSLVEVVRLP